MAASDPVAIEVRNVSVTYRVYADRPVSLRQKMTMGRSREFVTVRAVEDVSFTVGAGEVVGLIGTNGSGKSTLLSAIAGLQPVSAGSIRVRGEPALLGVGAVLNNQLSGARNVLLGCMALGMSRREAEAAFDDVVDFAALRHAIDRPMRTYSSGMRQRLHFAIATSVQPDVLLIDEVLAVGDRDFRRRSMRRVEEIRSQASVVVLVSHSLRQVTRACTRALWLDDGHLMADGQPDAVIGDYLEFTGGGGVDED
jgi:teichoic acid transport system ATP-binding protein